MGFKNTEWELSNEVVSKPAIEYGDRYLFIENATYDPNDKLYKLYVVDLVNNASFSLAYWLEGWNKERTEKVKNEVYIGTLNTLGEALAGTNIGIPNPQDIIGGVVMGEIKQSNPNADGKVFARCYKFSPVPADIASCATIDQYYIGSTE